MNGNPSSSGGRRKPSTRLKMKDLEQATGVGREAIRFYIREGLLPEPERPARNVAYYDAACVERIQFIKELQQKRYLPLHVIKAIVGGQTPPSREEAEAILALDGKVFPQENLPAAREKLADLAARTGLSVNEILEIADAGAIEISTQDTNQWVAGSSVRLVELWGRIRAEGFTEELGFTTDLMRVYVDTLRMLAREELHIFSRTLIGKVPVEKAARMAELGIELGNQAISLVRKEILLRTIATGTIPGDEPDKPAD